MKKVLLFLMISSNLFAQDNYHVAIEQMIANTYGLQNGEWMLFDDEVQNLTIDYNYGSVDLIQLTTNTEDFTQVTNILNEVEGGYFYDSGWGISNQSTIQQNDVCLLIVNLRKTNNVNDLGKISLGIQAADNSIFEDNIVIQLEENWNQYLIPFQASTIYLPDELIIALGLAWEVQEIELAGINILNFGNNYTVEELPLVIHNDRYGGYEADAPWRAEAAARIEANRKADLDISVTDINNNPVSGAAVEIRMLEHEFKWGTEIDLSRFAGNNLHEQEFENKLLDLDGQGHKFNWVAPGASFKWPGIEEGWIAPSDQKINAVNWLKDNDYNIRFHTLVWPGWINCPFDIEANSDDPQYIINRTNDWIDFILNHPELQNIFDEYDVLNETTTNRDYEMTFAGFGPYVTGREYYIEVMNQFSAIVPDKPNVIVDYVTISSQQYKGTEYDFLQNTIQELVDGGVELDGIGFQAHMSSFPTSLYEVEEILNDFAERFNTPLKITEFDFLDPRIDPDVSANYLDDFLTMMFSIPEVDMFIFWGMWDGAHWTNSGNLFYLDWTPKPAAAVTFNKLFNEWWTEEDGETNNDGNATFRGFKGQYEITIQYEGQSIIDTITLTEDRQLTYNLDETSAVQENDRHLDIDVFPNPTSHLISIESQENISIVELYSLTGKKIISKTERNSKRVNLNVEGLPNGIYVIKINIDGNFVMKKIELLN